MHKKPWLSFYFSILIIIGLACAGGFVVIEVRSNQLQSDFLKQNLRLNNHFYLQNLNKKTNGWQKEALRIIDQEKIPTQSPFSALALNPGTQEEIFYVAPDLFDSSKEFLKKENSNNLTKDWQDPKIKGAVTADTKNQNTLKGKIAKNQPIENIKLLKENNNQKTSLSAGDLTPQNSPKNNTKNTNALFFKKEQKGPLSQFLKHTNPKVAYQFLLNQIKTLTKNTPSSFDKNQELTLAKIALPYDNKQDETLSRFLFLFSSSYEKNNRWAAFLKNEKEILPNLSLLEKRNKNQETFIVDQKGFILMSNKKGVQTGFLSKKSPLLTILQQMTHNFKTKSRYLKTSDKKTGRLYFYHIQKWNKGGLFFVSRQSQNAPIFSLKNIYFNLGLATGALFFILAFRVVWIRLFSLLSAYRFLKQAFLIFNKTGLFPESPKNPLLYFYNNRKMFLNQRQKDSFQQDKKMVTGRFNIREIIRQETQKLKARFPLIDIKEDFDFDTRVFGFERFFRSLIHELLLNSLEAMGGLKNPRLDLSLKEKEGDLMFSIRDYGVGIRTQDHDKIFRVYYSTKSQIGVGLNLVQSIVKANGGTIQFDSPKDGGCLVKVRLPIQCFLKNNPKA